MAKRVVCCYVNNSGSTLHHRRITCQQNREASVRAETGCADSSESADANTLRVLTGLGIGLRRAGRPTGAVLRVVVVLDRLGDAGEDVELFRGEHVGEAVMDALHPGRPGRLES